MYIAGRADPIAARGASTRINAHTTSIQLSPPLELRVGARVLMVTDQGIFGVVQLEQEAVSRAFLR